MDSYEGIFCYGPQNMCSALQDLTGCVFFFVFLLHASPQIKFEMECRFQKPMVWEAAMFFNMHSQSHHKPPFSFHWLVHFFSAEIVSPKQAAHSNFPPFVKLLPLSDCGQTFNHVGIY